MKTTAYAAYVEDIRRGGHLLNGESGVDAMKQVLGAAKTGPDPKDVEILTLGGESGRYMIRHRDDSELRRALNIIGRIK
jgi:hypothetical protein